VLTLHGAMGGCDQSELLARTIGPHGRRYLNTSRPGYLATPLSSGRRPEAQADLFAALLDVLDIDRVPVLAVSGGGPPAIHFAARHPARCRALVLCSTCGTSVDTPIPWSFRIMTMLARLPPAVAWFRSQALRDPEASARRSILDPDIRARTLADPEVAGLMRALTASTFDRMSERLPGTANDIRVTRRLDLPLGTVAVPTLVVHGTGDRMVPFDPHATTLAARIAGAELLALDGGEHVGIFTHRPEVRARVGQFLDAHA
jgi:pimeloyl-ACP methyl ester carboxylesterase